MLFSLIGLFALLCASAFFSGTETAYTSLSDHEIHDLAVNAGPRGRQVQRHLERPAILLTTILIGNNLANIGAAAIVTLITEDLFGAKAVSAASGLLTLVVLIFCEVSPKRIAIAHNRALTVFTAYPLLVLGIVLRPFVILVSWISSFITRFFGGGPVSSPSLDGILSLVHAAESAGVVKGYEGRMVKRIFRLDDIPVQTVMTHRTEVFSLERKTSVKEAVAQVIKEGYSRIPVYDGDPELVVGVVLAKDMLKAYAADHQHDTVGSLMKKPIFVSDAWKINDVFSRFQRDRLKLAVVLDEYGGFSGIITLEDIAEEVFGEIYDETDERAYDTIAEVEDGVYRVAGETSLPMIQDALDITLPGGRPDQTLGAYILEYLERLPDQGETIELETIDLDVERVQEMRIASVLLRPRSQEGDEPSSDSNGNGRAGSGSKRDSREPGDETGQGDAGA